MQRLVLTVTSILSLTSWAASSNAESGRHGCDPKAGPCATDTLAKEIDTAFAFRRRLEELGTSPIAGVNGMFFLRDQLGDQGLSIEVRRGLAATWLEFVEQQASAWCSDTSAFSSPFYAELFSFDESQWHDMVVDANDWAAWVYQDRNEGKESCGGSNTRHISKTGEIVFDLYPPPPPVVGMGMCDGSELVPSVNQAWNRWNLEWDRFERLTHSPAWMKSSPFIWASFDDGKWGYKRNSEAQLDLKVLPGNQVVLTWKGVRLLTAVVPEAHLCLMEGEQNDTDCNAGIESAYYAPGSLMLRFGDGYDTQERMIPFSNPDAPVPFLFCAAGRKPIIRLPPWVQDLVATHDDNGQCAVVSANSVLRFSQSEGAANPPDMAEIDALLRSEGSNPVRAPGTNIDPELELVERVMKEPLYRDLDAALSKLNGTRLPRRLQMIDGWLRYLRAPAAYKQQLIDYDIELKRQAAEEKRAMAEYARQERERKVKESRLLASVPALGARCRQAIQDWRSSSALIDRAAVAGQPSVVKSATTRRDAAAKRVCDAVNSLREAIKIYESQGLGTAASAITREHWHCLSSCR